MSSQTARRPAGPGGNGSHTAAADPRNVDSPHLVGDTAKFVGLRERQKRQRGDRILASAARLIGERGYDGVTIEDIAADAEVSPATVHNYYETKGRLLLAVVQRGDESIFEFASHLADDPSLDAVETVCRLMERTSERSLEFLSHTAWRHAIAISITREDPVYGTGFSDAHRRFIKAYDRVLQVIRDRGALRPDTDTGVLASILYRIQHSLFIEMISESAIDVARYRESQRQHVQLIMQSLARSRRPGS
jgi:AcrR family transcriptional regulator